MLNFDLKKEKPPISSKDRFNRVLNQEPALKFIDKLYQDNPDLELYLVGGMTRDILLNADNNIEKKTKSKDFDFLARGLDIDTLCQELKKFGSLNQVGKNFGVLKFMPSNEKLSEPIDIALPRRETPAGTGGYRDVETQSDHRLSVEEDLSRRDLTINAIAYNTKTEKIHDPFNGRRDLADQLIRAVGKPEQRFQEDYSRMLRAVRFACRFDFNIEKNTWRAMKKLMPHLNDVNKQGERIVPWETIGAEIKKAFSDDPLKALDLLDKSGALQEIMPEILELKNCEQPKNFHSEGDVWIHTELLFSNLQSPAFKHLFPAHANTPAFIFGILLHDIGKPACKNVVKTNGQEKIQFHGHDKAGTQIAGKICDRLKFTSEQKQKITFMIKNHMFAMSEDLNKISNHKIAQRFLDSPHAEDLLKLFFLDCASSLRPDGSPPMENFYLLLDHLDEIKKIRSSQPKKIIDGETVMRELKISSGPQVGKIIREINELKDQGKINSQAQAISWLKKRNAEY